MTTKEHIILWTSVGALLAITFLSIIFFGGDKKTGTGTGH